MNNKIFITGIAAILFLAVVFIPVATYGVEIVSVPVDEDLVIEEPQEQISGSGEFIGDGMGGGSGVEMYILGIEGAVAKYNYNEDKLYFYTKDHLGSNRIMTDSSGYPVWMSNYYAFGSEFSPTSGNDYKFTGKEFDSKEGLYYYGARYYDPVIGRFTQADIVRGDLNKPQSLNRYAYTLNNPLKYVDPTGSKEIEADATFVAQQQPLSAEDSLYIEHGSQQSNTPMVNFGGMESVTPLPEIDPGVSDGPEKPGLPAAFYVAELLADATGGSYREQKDKIDMSAAGIKSFNTFCEKYGVGNAPLQGDGKVQPTALTVDDAFGKLLPKINNMADYEKFRGYAGSNKLTNEQNIMLMNKYFELKRSQPKPYPQGGAAADKTAVDPKTKEEKK
jgi:RHS repeat-associated protein